jgi:uncharacterized Ntn-hydrolase superfamily protein
MKPPTPPGPRIAILGTDERLFQITYSIVARETETGELGVAVQSHWFAVGSVVSWARPAVGAVATQAIAEIAHGPRVLALMEQGADAQRALAESLGADSGAAMRQVAAVDASGGVAVHTGSGCIPFAGHVTGDAVACQANMMASEHVWPAMLEAYGEADGPLATRLLAALEAAEAEGGDVRGRQSAAILVVPAAGEPWEAAVSVRVDDDPEPLVELRRLLVLHEAYQVAERADSLVGEGRHEEAAAHDRRASERVHGNAELRFWAGLGMAQAGDLDAGVGLVRGVIEADSVWQELLERLSPAVAPSATAVREQLRDRPTRRG